MPLIWSESYLSGLADDAERDVPNRLDLHFTRFSITTTAGQSVYQLPVYVRGLIRVTWKGAKVWPISWREMIELNPTGVVVSEGQKNEASQGVPLYYCLHPGEHRSIQFYPTPNEAILADDTKIWSTSVSDIVAISAWRTADPSGETHVLPGYMSRRIKKAYMLMLAFLKEGKGQNIVASDYYRAKYDFLVMTMKRINSGVFVSKQPRLSDQIGMDRGRKPARPVLPPNFPR